MDMAHFTITLPDFIILWQVIMLCTQIPQEVRMLHSATKQGSYNDNSTRCTYVGYAADQNNYSE